MKGRKIQGGIFVLLLTLAVSLPAQAAQITFTDFVKFEGSVTGANVTATIEDYDTNKVKITMDATALLGSDKITEWYFNVNNTNLVTASITYDSGVNGTRVVDFTNSPAMKPDGDGYFDIRFDFPQPPKDGTFGEGQNSVWIAEAAGLDALDFMRTSFPGPGMGSKGPYYSALKLGVAYWGSNTVTGDVPQPAPEPATMLLLGFGLIGLWGLRRKLKN